MARRPATRPPARDTILRVAVEEFARHGFAATRVDTLARRARVNKALIYYYFGSKLALYRTILRDQIRGFADAMREVVDAPVDAERKIARWIERLAERLDGNRHVSLIMLRELADGGSHLDTDTLRDLTAFLPMIRRVIAQGQDEGVFTGADPIALHFMLMGSTLLFTSNAPIRRRIRQLGLAQPALDIAPFVRHLQQVTIRSLRKDPTHATSTR